MNSNDTLVLDVLSCGFGNPKLHGRPFEKVAQNVCDISRSGVSRP